VQKWVSPNKIRAEHSQQEADRETERSKKVVVCLKMIPTEIPQSNADPDSFLLPHPRIPFKAPRLRYLPKVVADRGWKVGDDPCVIPPRQTSQRPSTTRQQRNKRHKKKSTPAALSHVYLRQPASTE